MNVFKKIWNSISLNGIENQSEARLVRTRVLSNQLNATVFILTLIVFIVVTLIRIPEQSQLYALQERFFLVLGMSVLHYLLVRYKCFTSAKLLLIFVLPLLVIVLPTVLGHVTNQSFFNYVFILISLSVLPQLILYFKKQKALYVISLIYYLLLLFSNRSLLTAFASSELEIVPLIERYSFLYEIVSIAIALFVNLMMYNLNKINAKVEQQLLEGKEKLEAINQNLDLHIEELKATNEQLRNAQQQLIQSEKMASLGVLTAGVAHEVNTPLNFISTGSLLVNNALEDLSDGVSREEIKQQLQQGSEIINKGIDQASFVVS